MLFADSPGKTLPDDTIRQRLGIAADWIWKRGWLDRFVVTGFDEPKQDKYEQVRRVGQLTRAATGGRLKHFLPGARPDPVFQDFVDIWDSVWVESDLAKLAERRKAGQRAWYCGGLGAPGNPVIDSRAYGACSWVWVGWKYGFDGFEMWHAIYWVDKFNLPREQRSAIDANPAAFLNVWRNPAPLTFDESRKHGRPHTRDDILQNGGAVFFYPGYDLGLPREVLPSLRLKDFRRGAQDYEYLWLLKQAGAERTNDEVMAMIYNPDAISLQRGGSPKIKTGGLGVTMDESVWETARRKMGERLERVSQVGGAEQR